MKYFIGAVCDIVGDGVSIPLYEDRAEWDKIDNDTVFPEKGFFDSWYLLNQTTDEEITPFSFSLNGKEYWCEKGCCFDAANKARQVHRPFLLHYDMVSFSVVIGETEYRSRLHQCVCKWDSDTKNLHEIVSRLASLPGSVSDVLRWPNGSRDDQATEEKPYSLLTGSFTRSGMEGNRKDFRHISKIYNKYQAFFLTRAEHKLSRKEVVVPLHRAKTVTAGGLTWSVRNGSLVPLPESGNHTGLTIGGKQMLPVYTLSTTTVQDRNIYENLTIVSFLDTVTSALRRENAANRLGRPGNYHTPDMLLFREQTYRNEENGEILAEIENSRRSYRRLMGTDERLLSPVYSLPTQTKIFQEIPAYRDFYLLFSDWFSGGYSFQRGGKGRYKAHLADTLYENFCWVCLIRLFLENGFSKRAPSQRTGYGKQDYDIPRFSNIVFLQKGETKVTLFNQPVIRTPHISQISAAGQYGFSLYKRSMKINDPQQYLQDIWTPDYLIKAEIGQETHYGVMDAKFRTMDDLFPEYGGGISVMEECLVKYYLNITDKENGFPVRMLWLLQGRTDNASEYSEIRDGHDYPGSFYPDSFFPQLSYGAVSCNAYNHANAMRLLWKEIERVLLCAGES